LASVHWTHRQFAGGSQDDPLINGAYFVMALLFPVVFVASGFILVAQRLWIYGQHKEKQM
jgi:hypothetical protein